jgi:sugar/nucleoside kinase (ribokinase family)
MTSPEDERSSDLDVVAVGHAIVDVLTHVDDPEVERLGLVKGAMTLVDAERGEALYAAMGPAVEVSGGSAANTVAGIASFGGATAFVGKVADDQLGAVFAHDLRAAGVEYTTSPAVAGPPTGRCLVMVTPDAHRTMSTYLGAARGVTAQDIDEALVRRAKVTYLEGYLWDPPEAIDALRRATGLAREAGRDVALTLSDPFCVERHREEFLLLLDGQVDLLFANEHEITSLFQVATFEEAVSAVAGRCRVAALTRSAKGSVVVTADSVHEVPAEPVAEVVDTTGAGDLYAAGFLFGITHGQDLERCARLGSLAAAEVISHIGARPQVSLSELTSSR